MKHVMITSGAKGIGRVVTERLIQDGWYISILQRNPIDWEHEHIHMIEAGLTDREQLLSAYEEAVERFGEPDALILNAGPYIFERKPLVELTDEEWDEVLTGNLSASFWLMRRAIPSMRTNRFGRIISYGFPESGSAPGWIHRSAFAAAKTALVSLTKSVALEEAPFGITANMVNPGNIVGSQKEMRIEEAEVDEGTPVGRHGTGEDIARLISFLLQEESDMITGAVIDVTGGVNVVHQYRK
ncbi:MULTISPECIES: SDR family oxidoreductase [unclassified Exiguobacterium]|uniref:SDR family oxidoreductase n=1 Tax=unclassified Exiguobacterium TaxID=2644629 RepID=UPI001BEB0C06|nr:MULTISPECIES: SDR family oxidoreductase [unclassified Exiguobacterium]